MNEEYRYQYEQYISLLTNTYKYRLVHTINTNTYHTSNTGQYRAIFTIMYPYTPISTIHVSIPAHMIREYITIYTNTCNTYKKYIPIHATIHTMSIHDQYVPQYIPPYILIHMKKLNTYTYSHVTSLMQTAKEC